MPMQEKLLGLSELQGIYKDTPKVTVYSNTAELAVRQLSYYRAAAKEAAKVRILLQRYDGNGQLKSSIDPRLSESYLKKSSSIVPNEQRINTLSSVLQSNNIDAGSRVVINNCQGQPLWS